MSTVGHHLTAPGVTRTSTEGPTGPASLVITSSHSQVSLTFGPHYQHTVHHRPSPSITVHHRPSPSITVHHRPSPSITFNHLQSPSITFNHLQSPSTSTRIFSLTRGTLNTHHPRCPQHSRLPTSGQSRCYCQPAETSIHTMTTTFDFN
jgi:hypothetical protein